MSSSNACYQRIYRNIMLEAVSYEIPPLTRSISIARQISKLLVKIADAIFSLFSCYSIERAALKERLIRPLLQNTSPPPSTPTLSAKEIVSIPSPQTAAALPPQERKEEPPVQINETASPTTPTPTPEAAAPPAPKTPPIPAQPAAVPSPKPTASTAKHSLRNTLWKCAKVAGIALLALGGAAALSHYFTPTPTGELSGTEQKLCDFQKHQIDTSKKKIEIGLKERINLLNSNDSLIRPQMVQINFLKDKLQAAPCDQLEEVATSVNALQSDPDFFGPTHLFKGTAPLSALDESTPAQPPTPSQMQAIVEGPKSDSFNEAKAISYLKAHFDRAENLGNTRVESLKHGLTALETFVRNMDEAAAALAATTAKSWWWQKANPQNAWDNGLEQLQTLVREQLEASQAFIIPGGIKGEILHFIPQNNSWTVRLYDRQTANSVQQFHPYIERSDLRTDKILSFLNPFLPNLLYAHMETDANARKSSYFSVDVQTLIRSQIKPTSSQQWLNTPISSSPQFPNLYDHSMPKMQHLQSSLNDLIHVELGPKALLNFQTAAFKNYLDAHALSLSTDKSMYTVLQEAHKRLSYAHDWASRQCLIDPETLKNKNQILNSLGNKLKLMSLSLTSYLRDRAPSVLLESGRPVNGEIPSKFTPAGSLAGKVTTTFNPPKYHPPIPLIPEGEVSFVHSDYTGNWDRIKEYELLRQLPQPLEKKQFNESEDPEKLKLEKAALEIRNQKIQTENQKLKEEQIKIFTQIRSWIHAELQNSESLASLNPKSAEYKIIFLQKLVYHMPHWLTLQDFAATMADIVTLADYLIPQLADPILKDAHLPLPQILRLLQNQGLFGNKLPLDQLKNRAETVAASKKEPFFAQAIGDSQWEQWYYTPHSKLYFFSEMGEPEIPWGSDFEWDANNIDKGKNEPAPWPYERLLTIRDPAKLPPHIKASVKNSPFADPRETLRTYATGGHYGKDNYIPGYKYLPGTDNSNYLETHHSVSLRNYLHTIMHYTSVVFAHALTEQVQAMDQKLSKATPASVIDAVKEWTKNLNPASIDSLALEMLTAEQSDALLTSLGHIAGHFFTANFLENKGLPDSDTMLSMLELLTLADRVMAYSPRQEHRFYRLPLEQFREIIEGRNPFFRTFNAEADCVRIQGLRDWLDERRRQYRPDVQPLFGNFQGFLNPEDEKHSLHPVFPPEFELASYLNRKVKIRPYDYRVELLEKTVLLKDPFIRNALSGYLGENPQMPPWFFQVRNLVHFCFHTMRSGFVNPLTKSSAADFTPVVYDHGKYFYEHFKDTFVEIMSPSKEYGFIYSYLVATAAKALPLISASGVTIYSAYKDITEYLNNPIKIQHRLKGITPEEWPADVPDGTTKGHAFSHLAMPIHTPGLQKQLYDLHMTKAGNYTPGIHSLPRTINDLNIAMTLNPIKNPDAATHPDSTDAFRIKYALRAEPELQIFKTLDYYMEKSLDLTQLPERNNFLNQLFDPGLLSSYLQNPETIPTAEQDLCKFLYNQYAFYQQQEKALEMQAFFIEAAIRVKQVTRYAREAAAEAYKPFPLSPQFEELCRVPETKLSAADAKLSNKEKSTYGALRAISFLPQQKLEKQEVVPFLNAVLGYRSFAPIKFITAVQTDEQIDSMLVRFEPQIMAVLYPNGTSEPFDLEALKGILKGLVANLDEIDLQPSAVNPLVFSNAAGTLHINLQDGVVIQHGQAGVEMPKMARKSLPYKMVYGGEAHRGMYLDNHNFQFTDNQGRVNILQKDNSSVDEEKEVWRLYRKIDGEGEPHQMVSADWTEQDAATKIRKPIPWLQSDWLLTQYTHWHRSKPTPEVRLLDAQGQEAMRVTLSGWEGRTIASIEKQDPNSEQPMQLADITQEVCRWTSQLEDPRYAHVWLNKKTQAGQRIEFPRFDLAFTARNGRWFLENEPQYAVVDPQLHPLFPGEVNFIHLRSAKGAERLLVPRFKPVLNNQGSLTFDRQPQSRKLQRLFTFEKKSKSGKFEGADPESNLYLALLHTVHGNFGRAHELLTTAAGQPLVEETLEILDWIVDGSVLQPNDTPQAIAIRTFAAHLKQRQLKTQDNPALAKLQERYLQIIQGIPHLRLPLLEEHQLFKDRLSANGANAEQLLAQMQRINPVAAKKALDKALPKLLYSKQSSLNLNAKAASHETSTASTTPPVSTETLLNLVTFEKQPANSSLSKPVADIFNPAWRIPIGEPTRNLLQRHERGAEIYQKNRLRGSVNDPAAFTAQRAELEKKLDKLALERETLRLEILDAANPYPDDPQKADRLKLQYEAGTARPVSFDQLTAVFNYNDIRRYQKLNPSLSEQQARTVDQLLQKFIDAVPELHYHQRLVDAMRSVEAVLAKQNPDLFGHIVNFVTWQKSPDPAELQYTLLEYKAAVDASRQFPPDAKRLLKVMEYETATYYRGMQINTLGRMGFPGLNVNSTEGSAVHSMEVGAGKTSRILPSLLQMHIEKGKLALAIMPEAQIATAGQEFAHIMKEVYNVDTTILHFSRNGFSADTIKAALNQLNSAKEIGSPVLTTGKSMRVLHNLLIEHYTKYVKLVRKNDQDDKSREALKAQEALVDDLIAVVKIFKEATPLIDEVHKEYDTRVETNHPFGQSLSLPKEYYTITLTLYELLRDDADIQALMHFNCIPKEPPEGAQPFNPEDFKNKIAPLLAEKFLTRLKSRPCFDPELEPLTHFLQSVPVERWQSLIDYLHLPAEPEWIQNLGNDHIKQQLALVRGQLTKIMPLTLNHDFGQRYGFGHPSDIIPLPFSAAGKPNLESQFSSPFVRSNYLIQAAFYEGIRKPLIAKIVWDLKQERLKEFNAQEVPLLGQYTPTDGKFQKQFKAPHLGLDTPDVEDKLVEHLSSNPSFSRHFIKEYTLPKVQYFEKNLKATSQNLGHMFSTWQAMSGTTGNYPSYPNPFTEPTDDTLGRMLTLMAEQTASATHTPKIRDPRKLLDDPIFLKADAFVDAGAIFAAENDVQEFACAWAERAGKACVTIDPVKGVVIRRHPKDKPVALRDSNIPLDQRLMFYDQANTMGTDAAHKKDAMVLASVSKSTTYSELKQAAGRARGIESGQHIEFIILEDDAILIRKKLGLPADHLLTSADVIRHTLLNESEQQMSGSESALHYKLNAVIENGLFDYILSKPPITQDLDNLLDAVYLSQINVSPYDLFGKEEVLQDKDSAFQDVIGRLTNNTLLERVFKDKASALRTQMEETTKSNLKYINDEVSTRPASDLEHEQEMQVEQQQQAEQLQEQQQQQEQESTQQRQATEEQQLFSANPGATVEPHLPWKNLNSKSIGSWDFWQPPLNPTSDAHFKKVNKTFIHKAFTFVDEGLLISSNYLPKWTGESLKPAQFVAIIKNKNSNDYRIAFLDSWETNQFRKVWQARKGIKLPVGPMETGWSPVIPAKHTLYDPALTSFIDTDAGDFKCFDGNFIPTSRGGWTCERTTHYHPELSKLIDFNLYPGPYDKPVMTQSDLSVYYGINYFNFFNDQPTEGGDADIWVGSLTGRHAFGNHEVFNLQNPKLKRLWAQAQVFGGRFDFADDKLMQEVKDWLKDLLNRFASQSKNSFLKALRKEINEMHATKEVADFDSTDLGKLFKSLID